MRAFLNALSAFPLTRRWATVDPGGVFAAEGGPNDHAPATHEQQDFAVSH